MQSEAPIVRAWLEYRTIFLAKKRAPVPETP
jgi:hypothetical protein